MRDFDTFAATDAGPEQAGGVSYVLPEGGGPILLPEGFALFSADFGREGADLHVTARDGAELRIPGYFDGAPADLLVEGGGLMRGGTVRLLAGPEAPGQYAQAGTVQTPAVGGTPIGQVETLDGTAFVQRGDGTVEDLSVGEKVFLNDVVWTDPASTCAITFVDGTIFTLQPDSRMTLDELVYTAGAQSGNSAAFNLIQGGFVFIAGQVAPTGGIDIQTPAATMGIRGTTLVIEIISEADGTIRVEMRLMPDVDTAELGFVTVTDTQGNLLGTIEAGQEDVIVTVNEPDGAAETITFQSVARSAADSAEASAQLAIAAVAFTAAAARQAAGRNFVDSGDGTTDATGPVTTEDDGSEQSQDDFDTGAGVGGSEIAPLVQPEDPAPVEDAPSGDTGGSGGAEPGLLAPLQPQQQNLLPETLDDELTILEDSPFSGALPGGPADAETRFTLVSAPRNGTVAITDDGGFAYVPDADFAGTDSFSYRVDVERDGERGSDIGTITVQVDPVNDAPVPGDVASDIDEDRAITATIPAQDADGDPLVFTLVTGPERGSLDLRPDGSFTYTPEPDFNGEVRFTYAVSDGQTRTEGTARLTVRPVNDPPLPAAPILAEDEDSVIEGRIAATDVDGDPLIYAPGPQQTVNGTLTLRPDGGFTYRPDPDFAGTDGFDYTVTDGSETRSGRVEITVRPTNDAPEARDGTAVVVDGIATGRIEVRDPDPDESFAFAPGETRAANGTVTVTPDGSFTYTPEEGFAGFDQFDVTVTDSGGATDTARIAVIVGESAFVQQEPGGAPGGEEGGEGGEAPPLQNISVEIVTEGDEDTPAGSVQVSIAPPPPQEINLVVLLDRSFSIFRDWEPQKQAVAEALTDVTNPAIASLFERFEGSASTINVHVVSYAGGVTRIGNEGAGRSYDLATDREALRADILAAEFDLFDSLGSSYGAALAEAKAIFDAADAGTAAANVIYLLTDGAPAEPVDGPFWQDVIAAFSDPGTLGYEVTIEAFGIGPAPDFDILDQIDSGDATAVDTPADLVDAFAETPLFQAELVGLSLQLIADGQFLGEVADETTPGFEGADGDAAFALANIPGAVDLIGESNAIFIEATFDTDGDPDNGAGEIVLRTGGAIGVGESAVDRTGTAQNDLIFGSVEADRLDGAAGDDLLIGGAGDDSLIGGAGVDSLRGGAGDDLLDARDGLVAGEVHDGGAGRDTLALTIPADDTAQNDLLPTLDIRGIEAISLENGTADALALSTQLIASLSEEADTDLEALLGAALPESATVHGEAGDTLALDLQGGTAVQRGAPVTDAGGTEIVVYDLRDGEGTLAATIGVDAELQVQFQNAGAGA